MISEKILLLAGGYYKEETGEESILFVMERDCQHAFRLADHWATLVQNFFETGQGMTTSEALNASMNVAHLLQSGNETLASYNRVIEDLKILKREFTLKEILSVVFNEFSKSKAGTRRKIECIKKIRDMTGMGLKESKDLVEFVISEIDSGTLVAEDLHISKNNS